MPYSRGSSRPRDRTHISYFSCIVRGFPGGSNGKESACDVGDLGSNPVSGRCPGEENGYSLVYSCLENSMDRGAWEAGYSQWSCKDLDMTEQLKGFPGGSEVKAPACNVGDLGLIPG